MAHIFDNFPFSAIFGSYIILNRTHTQKRNKTDKTLKMNDKKTEQLCRFFFLHELLGNWQPIEI